MGGGGTISASISSIKHNRSYMRGNQLFKNNKNLQKTTLGNYQNEKAELSEAEKTSIRRRIHMKYSLEKSRFRFVAFITTGIAVALFAIVLNSIF